MLSWHTSAIASGDAVFEIRNGDDVVAHAGFAKLGQRVGRAGISTGLKYFFEAPGGRRIWFSAESALRGFVDTMFTPTLGLGDRHQAVLVGLMWAHDLAYKFDVNGDARPLPQTFPGRPAEIADLLLDRSEEHVRNSSPIVWAAAEASWEELRARPLADRPFPILQ
jgi:hypothetical protein